MEPDALELLCAKALGMRMTAAAWVKAGVVGVVRQQNYHKYILPCATDNDNYPEPIMAYSLPQPPWVLSPAERPAPFSERVGVLLEAAQQRQAEEEAAKEAAANAAAAENAARKSRSGIQNTMKKCTTSGGRSFSVPANYAVITNKDLNALRRELAEAQAALLESGRSTGAGGDQFVMNGHSQRNLELAMAALPGTSAVALANAFPLLVAAWMASAWGPRRTREQEEERHVKIVRSSPGVDAIQRAVRVGHERQVERLALRIVECGAKHFAVGSDKGQGKLVITISFWNPKERKVEQHTLDSRDSGETSESVAEELANVLKKYLPAGCLIQSCTDSGGGGVGTSLATEMAGKGLTTDKFDFIVTFCSIHYLQTSLRTPWEKWLGAGGIGVLDAVQAAHSVFDVVKRVNWESTWDCSQKEEEGAAALRRAIPPRFRSGASRVYEPPSGTSYQLRPKKPSKPLFTRWWTMVVAMVTRSAS
jgi:hypothetical protein